MDDPSRVPSTDFSKKAGRDVAVTRADIVTRNGRDSTGSISAGENCRLHRGESSAPVDAATLRAATIFLCRIRQTHASANAILFGSRALGTHGPDSDADIAVILKGRPTDRFAVLQPLSDAAYDVLMETGIYIQPLPLWEAELNRPELFANPALIETIKRDGVRL